MSHFTPSLLRGALLLGALAAAGLTVGCGSAPQATKMMLSQNGGPSWIDQGGNAFKDGKLYAVGVDTGTSNISLRRSAADAKARGELSKIFTSRVANLIKTYDASTQDESREAAESHRQEATKAFSEMELAGTTICDRYYDKETRAQYALACMDAEAFSQQLEQMEKLSAQAKQIIRFNAERAFEELDAESAKKAAQ